jgi:threonine-phosphate decarboxylase
VQAGIETEQEVRNTESDIQADIKTVQNVRRTARVHGGNIYEAIKRYGLEGREILDFSSNVNPLGPSSAAQRAARKALALIDRYPDPAMTDLRKAIARYFGIKPEHVICGNGSNELIHLIPRVFRPKKVLVPMPTFTEYAAAVEEAGGEVVSLSLKEREGFRVDPLEMAFALKGVDMAFLCNPNNPTGLLIPKTDMLEIMRYALQHGVRLVVDEAFMDFIDYSESIVKDAVQASQLICLRAFTKFFGMPGLRIGYAVSDEATIAALTAGQEPWTVNIPAEHAAIAALQDWRHIKKTRRVIEKERNRLLSALRVLPGVEPFPGAANFIFIKVTSADASLLVEKLGLRGLLVRDCSSFPGLDGGFVRIAVRTRRENERLVKALRALLVRLNIPPKSTQEK